MGIWEGPTKECSGIDNGFGEVTHILEMTDTLAMISFTQVISQRIMSIDGDWELECFSEQDMFRGIIQMILASDDMGYLHQEVIDDDSEMVSGNTIGFNNDKVLDFFEEVSKDGILEGDFLLVSEESDSKVLIFLGIIFHSEARFQEFLSIFLIDMEAFDLRIRGERAADMRAFIKRDTEPLEVF